MSDFRSCMIVIKSAFPRQHPRGKPVFSPSWGALLYLYRPAELRVDLKDQLAEALLADAGYSGKSSEQCVAYLAKRFRSGGEFPHEVGLFLSYPPQDVRGFIENHAVNYKCAGLWKVYGDEALARRLFDKFRKCTDIYCALWRAGSGIDQLAVAV